jgi:aspartate 1-decarboxylase
MQEYTSIRARLPSFSFLGVAIFGRLPHVKVMQMTILKSKIHRAAVTGASMHYEGSMTIAGDLAEKVGLLPYEKILVGNMGNGERFETYVIYGKPGTGCIELNGATAHLGKIGDRVTIMNFGQYTPEEAATHRPKVIRLDEHNQIVAVHGFTPGD